MMILRTDRLVVDPIVVDDAPFFVDLVNSPGWLEYIGSRDVHDENDARRFLEQGFLRSYRDHGFGYYLVRTEAERMPIGICGFLRKPWLDNADFGFALLPEFHGRGYALEFGRAVLDYGVRTHRFGVLDAVTRPENHRSINLLVKLGFSEVGPVSREAADPSLVLYRRQWTLS